MTNETLRLALDALDDYIARIEGNDRGLCEPINVIRASIDTEQAKGMEAMAWRDHVEQRLLNWRQRQMNRSGDQLALDDFMDKQSLDDLIDFVCDEYTTPPAQPAREWVGLTDEERRKCWWGIDHRKIVNPTKEYGAAIESLLREKNAGQPVVKEN